MTQWPDLSKLTSAEKDAVIDAPLERVEELERRLELFRCLSPSDRDLKQKGVLLWWFPFLVAARAARFAMSVRLTPFSPGIVTVGIANGRVAARFVQ